MSSTSKAVALSPSSRVLSVDALRGFDMFWIVGGERLAKSLAPVSDRPVSSALMAQLTHVTWEGFRFFDSICPLFLVGVSIALSIGAGGLLIALVGILLPVLLVRL